MYMKMIGAALTVMGAAGVGFSMAGSHRHQSATLRQLISALEYMECELHYKLLPLPELVRGAAAQTSGAVSRVFLAFARELDCQIAPNAESCMNAAVEQCSDLPLLTKECFQELGRNLGRFDLPGQLNGLSAVRAVCRQKLESLEANKEVRLRSYQTLGLCAGAALAILLV